MNKVLLLVVCILSVNAQSQPTAPPTAVSPTVAPTVAVVPSAAPTAATTPPTPAPTTAVVPTAAPTTRTPPTNSPVVSPSEAPTPNAHYFIAGIDFELWENVLAGNVRAGNSKTDLGSSNSINLNVVNYSGIAASEDFTKLLNSLSSAKKPTELGRDAWYAFWINIYNILAVNTIVSHPCKKDLFGNCGPLESIRQVGEQQPAAFAKVWGIDAGNVGGVHYSLDDVENMLRDPTGHGKNFTEDSRLHACIVCASISCPNLRNESFVTSRVHEQMHDQMAEFLLNTGKGLALDTSANKVQLTPIFDWFKGDFNDGDVLSWIITGDEFLNNASFVSNHTKTYLEKSPSIKYFTYDWDVNGKTDELCGHAARACFPWWALLIIVVLIFAIIIVVYCVVRRRSTNKERYDRIINEPEY